MKKLASEVARLLAEQVRIREIRLEDMRRRIREGWDSLRRAEGVDGDEFMAQLAAELDALEEKQEKRRDWKTRFKLSAPAKRDLQEIVDLLAQDNIPAARKVVAHLTQVFRRIHVRFWRALNELGQGFRSSALTCPHPRHGQEDQVDLPVRYWVVGSSYLIVYDPNPQPLEVLRILHGSRHVDAFLETRYR